MLDVVYAWTVIAGRSAHAKKREGASVSLHRLPAYCFLGGLVLYVLLIERHVRQIGGTIIDPLFCVHMCFAAPLFALSFLLVFWLNGTRSTYHSRFAYASAMFMLGTNITGIPLILSRF